MSSSIINEILRLNRSLTQIIGNRKVSVDLREGKIYFSSDKDRKIYKIQLLGSVSVIQSTWEPGHCALLVRTYPELGKYSREAHKGKVCMAPVPLSETNELPFMLAYMIVQPHEQDIFGIYRYTDGVTDVYLAVLK